MAVGLPGSCFQSLVQIKGMIWKHYDKLNHEENFYLIPKVYVKILMKRQDNDMNFINH